MMSDLRYKATFIFNIYYSFQYHFHFLKCINFISKLIETVPVLAKKNLKFHLFEIRQFWHEFNS